MPLAQGGPKTLWFFTGVFLFMGVLVIAAPIQAMPVALFLPALYSLFASRVSPYIKPLAAAGIPATLVFIPGFQHGAVLYACLIACGVLISRFLARRDPGLAVLLPSVLLLILLGVTMALTATQEGMRLSAVISQWVSQVMDQMAQVYERVLSAGDFAEFRIGRPATEARLAELFWGLVASSMLSVMWLNVLIASRVIRTVPLSSWRGPDWMVALFILAAMCILVSHRVVHIFGLNLMIIISQIYFFQGLAIVAAFMLGYNWSKVIRWVVYILILSQIYIMIVVAVLGLFDTWFNFRKKIRIS